MKETVTVCVPVPPGGYFAADVFRASLGARFRLAGEPIMLVGTEVAVDGMHVDAEISAEASVIRGLRRDASFVGAWIVALADHIGLNCFLCGHPLGWSEAGIWRHAGGWDGPMGHPAIPGLPPMAPAVPADTS